MLSDDMTRMAREAGLHLPYWFDDMDPANDPPAGWTMLSPCGPALERFARAVERAAYERAAKECLATAAELRRCSDGCTDGRYDWKADGAEDCADAIRALGGQHD